MNADAESTARSAGFVPTRWTLVLRARGQSPAAQSALSELCDAYYDPVLAFIRAGGRNEDDARDLTQEFFKRLLKNHGLDTIDPERGRFRSFLLGAVKHFLADQYDRVRAAKRGRGATPVSIEAGLGAGTTAQLQIPDPLSPPPDALFDRQWAETLVARALNVLAAEFSSAGKSEQFEVLKPWLVGQLDLLPQADAARQLGLSQGALKVAIHRLRQRFRDVVKSEIAQTVPESSEIHDELRYLVEVLSSNSCS